MRSSNILVTEELECKIADFGNAINLGYPQCKKSNIFYFPRSPPEFLKDNLFTTKGDVYVIEKSFSFYKILKIFNQISFLEGY